MLRRHYRSLYRPRKADPLDGFNPNMRRALKLMQGVTVLSRGRYVPVGQPAMAIDPATITALEKRGCIAWIEQHGRRDAALSEAGRALQFIVNRREGFGLRETKS